MDVHEVKPPNPNAGRSMTPGSIVTWIFAALFNTALVLGAAALAFYVVAFNLMQHGDNAVPLMLSVFAAFVAGSLMAWACAHRHSKPPSSLSNTDDQ